MAQKRMFDKRVVESDRFTDLPNSSKALYFMAGMSADDKGFFQPRRLQKMCGFSEDDFKILVAKNYFIVFDSGVMVVTDWNKNNWLDSRRITETEYVDELKMLKLVNEKYEWDNEQLSGAKQMLSENSIDKNSIDKNSIDIVPQNDTVNDSFDKNVEDIIAYLNFKANTRYLPSTKSTRNLIKNLFNKSFTIDDFKYVIDTKCEKWLKDKKMVEYLRPKTLFAEENFANYVGGNSKTTHDKISNSSEYDELCERGLV